MSKLTDVMFLPLRIPKIIPSGWRWEYLTDICKPKQWRTISRSQLTDTGYPVFGANGFIGFYSEYNHAAETIAITCRGTCGAVNLVPPKTYITGNSMCLDSVCSEVSQKFLFYAIQFRTLSDVISGSAQPQITAEGLRAVSIPMPPLSEQKKIAAILTSVDEVIEATQTQINKLQALKKATMQNLLTKGIGHTKFKDTPLGPIPQSWQCAPLQSLAKSYKGSMVDGPFGSNMKTSDYVSSGVPVLQGSNITHDKFIWSEVRYISPSKAEELSRSSVRAGDILVVKIGSIGYSAIVDNLQGHDFAIIPANLLKIDVDESEALTKYVHYYLTSPNGKRRLVNAASSTAQPALSLSAMKQFKLPKPPIPEQERIVSAIMALDASIEAMHIKLAQTQSLKQALMQDLLTGAVRVMVE